MESSELERARDGLVLQNGGSDAATIVSGIGSLQRADPADDRGGLDALFLDHVLEALEEEIIAFEDRQDDPRRALRHEVVHRRPPTERWASTLHVGATPVKARVVSCPACAGPLSASSPPSWSSGPSPDRWPGFSTIPSPRQAPATPSACTTPTA